MLSFRNQFPHVVDYETPRTVDVPGTASSYDYDMNRVYLADPHAEDRTALKSLLRDVNLFVVGEAADWATLSADAPRSRANMVIVDWELVPNDPVSSLAGLRTTYPQPVVIVLTSRDNSGLQAERSSGADSFISKAETPDRVAAVLRAAAARVPA